MKTLTKTLTLRSLCWSVSQIVYTKKGQNWKPFAENGILGVSSWHTQKTSRSRSRSAGNRDWKIWNGYARDLSMECAGGCSDLINKVLQKFEEHVVPAYNETFERNTFSKPWQLSNEPLDHYILIKRH